MYSHEERELKEKEAKFRADRVKRMAEQLQNLSSIDDMKQAKMAGGKEAIEKAVKGIQKFGSAFWGA